MRKLVVGNWKMNGHLADLTEIAEITAVAAEYPDVDCGLCLPATLLSSAVERFPSYSFGGQDCHKAKAGAHTGCVSATMLADVGATMTLVGHSERRAAQGESDINVRDKAVAAYDAGLSVILCIGESEADRDAGRAEDVVLSQLAASLPDDVRGAYLSIAYEPVWAIGTGRIPTDADVAAMHLAIRQALIARFGSEGSNIRILYGGSMNGDNATGLLSIANVDGGLIGGASLSAAKFSPILAAAQGANE